MVVRLPLSGIEVGFREPDGATDVAVADLPLDRPVAAGIMLLERLAVGSDGAAIDARSLIVTDSKRRCLACAAPQPAIMPPARLSARRAATGSKLLFRWRPLPTACVFAWHSMMAM
jgi:hypothetical protein